MNGDPNLALLHDAGDPLEKLICQSVEPLFPVLSPYARVWAHHIYPRRIGDGSQIVAEWMPFGGSHYTALIRLFEAYRSKKRLLSLCKKAEEVKGRNPTADDYALLLEIHAATAAFWENLGSAVDNFGHVWDDARRILLGNAKNPGATKGDEPISYKNISRDRYPLMNYAYDRRTQFIHSALVPKRFEDGQVIFNLRHYDAKTTEWLPDTEVIEAIDDKVVKDWDVVIKELGVAWERLFSWLQAKDTDRPEIKKEEQYSATSDTPLSASNLNYVTVPKSQSRSIDVPPSGGSSSNRPK